MVGGYGGGVSPRLKRNIIGLITFPHPSPRTQKGRGLGHFKIFFEVAFVTCRFDGRFCVFVRSGGKATWIPAAASVFFPGLRYGRRDDGFGGVRRIGDGYRAPSPKRRKPLFRHPGGVALNRAKKRPQLPGSRSPCLRYEQNTEFFFQNGMLLSRLRRVWGKNKTAYTGAIGRNFESFCFIFTSLLCSLSQ